MPPSHGIFEPPNIEDMEMALAIRLAHVVTGHRDEQFARFWLEDARQIMASCPPPDGVLYRFSVTKHDPGFVCRRLGLTWPVEHDTTVIDYNNNFFLIFEEADGSAAVLSPDAWRERFPSPVPDPQEG